MSEDIRVQGDGHAFHSLKEKAFPHYKKVWNVFKVCVGTDWNWDQQGPTEEDVLHFIRWSILCEKFQLVLENSVILLLYF